MVGRVIPDQAFPGGRDTGGPAGSATSSRENMTCNECRQRMCTDELLTRLRCADCRQGKFEPYYDLAFMMLLIAITEAFTWMLTRRPQDRD